MNFTNSVVRKIVNSKKLIHGASVLVKYPKRVSINITLLIANIFCFALVSTVINSADTRASNRSAGVGSSSSWTAAAAACGQQC